MISNKYVDFYINQWEKGQISLNKERIQLIEFLREHILSRNDVFFDDEKIENCIKFTEKWYFPLQPFQKFIIAFVFLFLEQKNEDMDEVFISPYFREFFITLGRGGGKNGLISAITNFFLTPYHGIKKYDVSVVANSEDQAKVSFKEVYDMITDNDLYIKKGRRKSPFRRNKSEIEGIATKSIFRFNTSNAKTKDGGREGCVIFDEVHEYENSDIVNVKRGGLGKVPHGRTFYIGTDGHVREGFMDNLKDRALEILSGSDVDDRLFPFICKLDDKDEVNDKNMWEKANPMFHKPFSNYSFTLHDEVSNEYKKISKDISLRVEFMTKRMNLPEEDEEKMIATRDQIMATFQEIPDLTDKQCIGGLDFATMKDFAAVGLLFREDEKYIWLTHSFARKGFLDAVELKPPIYEWEERGLLTIVDEPTIDPRHCIEWFSKMREKYAMEKVILDNYRMEFLRPLFDDYGIDYEVIKNPPSIHGLLAPRIDDMFANENIIYGDNPLMRWYTNNVLVRMKADGNRVFEKKEKVRRKTDGFHAFVHALYRADELLEYDVDESLEFLSTFNI
ncbi:terminase TerL endonuclease subunit [Staphylococcus xylosus]|uniref:terminase TerL endonuclease subunit n=1 Tax=Staphylococcus xylosus TaxID=1288 RepID=UPI001C3EA69C|nr:terminase TerL endonuclease subunit [Staphylococcus xylosus]